jgi:hypothetical protein
MPLLLSNLIPLKNPDDDLEHISLVKYYNKMLEYFNKLYGYRELLERIGGIEQLAGARRFVFAEGRAKGTEAIDVRTGSGLNFMVLPDRGMDIAWAEFKGINLSYISPTGIVSPDFYDGRGTEWLRGFYAGLMTTCGLTQAGPPSTEDDNPQGLHGRASYIPAEKVSVAEAYENGEYAIKIQGIIREVKALGENIILRRKITAWAGKNRIRIEDIIENAGFVRQPFMILYHCNLGFPLINEKTAIYIPNEGIVSRYEDKIADIPNYSVIPSPMEAYEERVFFFKVKPCPDGICRVLTANDRDNPELGLQLSYNPETLDNLALWKLMAKGNYVIGLEPCNNFIRGQSAERAAGTLKYLDPGEKKNSFLEFEILTGDEIKNSPLINY